MRPSPSLRRSSRRAAGRGRPRLPTAVAVPLAILLAGGAGAATAPGAGGGWDGGAPDAPGAVPAPAAQEAPRPPEVVAQEFLDGFRASAWRALAQRVDVEALERFRGVVTAMTLTPRGEAVREALFGADSAGYAAMDDERVFAETAAGVAERMPGLLHALAVKDVEVVGAVRDASGDTAWAVYRSLARLQGAETEARVMTLLRRDGRWGVSRAPELDVLLTALRGLPLD